LATSGFVDFFYKVLDNFDFLVSKYSFQEMAPSVCLGGREASIEYVKGSICVEVLYESGSKPEVVVVNKAVNQVYNLQRLFKDKFPERYSRIYNAWYTSTRSNPAIARVLQENADFLQKEGSNLLFEDSWTAPAQ
jgi:hypothetical protein